MVFCLNENKSIFKIIMLFRQSNMGLQYQMNTCNLEIQNLKIQNFGNNSQSLIFWNILELGLLLRIRRWIKMQIHEMLHEIVKNLKDI